MSDESVVELKPNMPTYSSFNYLTPKGGFMWFHFNGIAIIDAIFEKKFPDRFPAFKGDMLHIERKQLGWPLHINNLGYWDPGYLSPSLQRFLPRE